MPEEIDGVMQGSAVRIRGTLPKKRRANLARVTRRRVRWEIPVLVLLGTALAVRLFVACGITARFQKLHAAREQLAEVQTRFRETEETMNRYYESRDTYFHITWDDMTEEEIGLVDPAEALDLLDRVVFAVTGRTLGQVALKENAVTLEIAMGSLEEANQLAERLRQEPMVEYSSVRRGSGWEQTEDGALYVTCKVEIRFKAADNSGKNAAKPSGTAGTIDTGETEGTADTAGTAGTGETAGMQETGG